MDIDKLLKIINSHSYHDLKDNTEIISTELKHLDIPNVDHHNLIKKILKIITISKNQKLRETYLRSYFRIYKEGKDFDGRPGSIIVEITKRCNKNCRHCYSSFFDNRIDMSNEILAAILRYTRKNCKHIFFTGGEPTLDPRILQTAKENQDMLFFVFTNGSTMCKNYAKQLFSLGNIIPMIGIDGGSASVHDYYRGDSSYDEVMSAIDILNKYNVPWGYSSLVTEQNIHDVLSSKFIEDIIKRGAFIARYLEYIPVGPKPLKDSILSGDSYYFLEKRKKEIINSGIIYMQETIQRKCTGLLYFTARGYIKNCFAFHYAKYNVSDHDIKESVKKIYTDWASFNWSGECPVYSDPCGLKNHLETLGWKKISAVEEQYLSDPEIFNKLQSSYRRFLELNAKFK